MLEGLWSESILAWGIATFAGSSDVERTGAWIREPGALAPLAWLTLTYEFALPVALWTRRLRGGAMVVGAGFHLGIALATQVWSFSLAMIATYLLFADPDALERLVRRVRAEPAPLREPAGMAFHRRLLLETSRRSLSRTNPDRRGHGTFLNRSGFQSVDTQKSRRVGRVTRCGDLDDAGVIRALRTIPRVSGLRLRSFRRRASRP